MECSQTTGLSNDEFLQLFTKKVAEERVPISGSLELTRQCNLGCVHCYLGIRTENRKYPKPELTAAQWIDIIDEITAAGCLYLLITGGEPLIKKGFSEVYTRAKKNGLIVTIFTNGTRVTDDILSLFKDLPPYAVEISLYGATPGTHDKITGVKGSYKRCINGIEKLLKHNLNLKLKTMLMTTNRHEFYDIKRMAEDYKVKFRFDAAIFAGFGGDRAPLGLRVDPGDAIEIEFSDQDRLQEYRDYYHRVKNQPVSDRLYTCGTGRTSFHIDSYGNLQPCLMVNSIRYDLSSGGFSYGWRNVIPGIRKQRAGRYLSCNQCDKMALCGYCPAFFSLENGTENIPSEYLCAMGHHRLQAIDDMDNGRYHHEI